MKIVIAPDSFKDGLPADEVAAAFAKGVKTAFPECECICLPMADGGEGTLRLMTQSLNGGCIAVRVQDPLGREIEGTIGWIADEATAIIELADASGIQRLSPSERNPLHTSTYGTGQQIKAALEMGAKKIYLTLGGSATNDMACGMAAALGAKFYSKNQLIERPTGAHLERIDRIETAQLQKTLSGLEVKVLCDVNNPLYGEQGAAFVYGPQKGADEEAVRSLDRGLRNMEQVLQLNIQNIPGSGAAGGCGGGAIAFLGAQLEKGVDAIMDLYEFDKTIASADWIITAEGKIDKQTFTGKVVCGIAKRAAKYKVPVIGICGLLELNYTELQELGLRAAFPVSNGAKSLADALQSTSEDIERLAANVAALLKA